MILVSSCLFGNNVRYNGESKPVDLLVKYKECKNLLPICPECSGGLPVPRPPAEIQNGSGDDVWRGNAQVKDKAGKDVTAAFKQGARFYDDILKRHKVSAVILKERSPSCGKSFIYDGSFTGRVIPGSGVTAAFFAARGIKIYSEEELTEELLRQLIAADNC